MNKQKLIAKRKALLEKIDAFLKPIDTENRDLTAAEKTTVDGYMAEVRSLAASIEQAEELEQAHNAQVAAENRAAAAPALASRALTGAPAIVGNQSEQATVDSFSFTRAFARLADGLPLEGVEREFADEGLREMAAAGVSRQGGNFIVPQIILNRSRHSRPLQSRDMEHRDMTAGTASQGGNLIQTDVQTIIGRLMADMPLVGLGAQFAGGLVGNLSFPTFSPDDQAAIKTEFAASNESSPTITVASMAPRRVPVFVEVTRQFLAQQSQVTEGMLRGDVSYQIRKVLETLAYNGSGSGEPYGLLNAVGVGSVAGGANGAAPTWDNVVDLETALANLDAGVGALGYLTNTKVRGKFKKTPIASNTAATMIWDRHNPAEPLNGYRCGISTLMPSNLTKGTSSGVCSGIVFGNFADCIIGQWGGVEFLVNPYSRDTEGIIRINAWTFFDFLVKRAASFAVMKDALTT